MGSLLFSVLFWAFITLSSACLYPFALLIRVFTSPFDRKLSLLHRFTSLWASLYTWFNPFWRVTIVGRERILKGMTYVMIANHQSVVDIFVLFRLQAHYKWVSKAENFRIPFIGWNMSLNRYIRIDRGSISSHRKMLRDAEAALREGNSLMIFPEGTRSKDGSLQNFKDGAFELAVTTRTSILPIVIEGSAEALPKRGIILRGRHLIRMRILDPVPAGISVPELRDRVHNLFVAEIASLRRQT